MGSLHVCFADMPQYGMVRTPLATALGPSRPKVQSANASSSLDVGDDAIVATSTTTPKERNLSPSESASSTPQRYERNLGFFRHLSRRFGLRRSQDDLVYCSGGEDDVHSSSTDSSGSVVQAAAALRHHRMRFHHRGCIPPVNGGASSNNSNNNNNNGNNCSLEHISCASSSETSSTIDIEEEEQQQPEHDEDDGEATEEEEPQQQQQEEAEEQPSLRTPQEGCLERKSANRSSFSRLQRRSASSLRRAFDKLTLTAGGARSLSCSGQPATTTATAAGDPPTPIKSALKSSSHSELNKRFSLSLSSSSTSTSTSSSAAAAKSAAKKAKAPPQRILRQPVSYTYLKGISGLPTQRVPRSSVCCQYARR